MNRLAFDPARATEQQARDLETLERARKHTRDAAASPTVPRPELGTLLAMQMPARLAPSSDDTTDTTTDDADNKSTGVLDRIADEAERRTKRHTLTFKSVGELIADPQPIDWLVRDILTRDSLALIFGDPGVGKSFLAIDQAASVATGTNWNEKRTGQAPVFYIAGEGHNGLARRFRAWEIQHATSLHDAPLFVSTMPAALTDGDAAAEAVEAVRGMTEQHGQPGLVVVDTVARNFGPGDENSTRDMSAFVAACDCIRDATGACVLLVHHSGHADKGRARGAIALKGALDWEYALIKDAGALALHCTKAKDADPPEPMAFRLSTVDLGYTDEDGAPVTSAVLTPAMFVKPSASGKAGRGKNQATALRALREGVAAEETKREAQGLDPGGAFLTVGEWRERCQREGLIRQRFNDVARTLERQGVIRIDGGRVIEQDPEFRVE